jgi:hypothetical protein
MPKGKRSKLQFSVGQEVICYEREGYRFGDVIAVDGREDYRFGDVTAVDGDKVTVALLDFTDAAVKGIRTEYREYTRRVEDGLYVHADSASEQFPTLRIGSLDEYYSALKKSQPSTPLSVRVLQAKSLVTFFFANLLDQRLDYLDRKFHEKKTRNG